MPPVETVRIELNGTGEECRKGTTVADLLARLEPARARACAIEVNRTLVPRARHAATELRDGDRVEIVTLVGGG